MAAVEDHVARTQLREHARRLDRQDNRLDEVDDQVADLRVDFAKLLGIGLFAALVLTIAANALIVHYLTPSGAQPPTVAVTSDTPH